MRILGVTRRISEQRHRIILRLQQSLEEQPVMIYKRSLVTRAAVYIGSVALVLSVSVSAMALERQLAGVSLGSGVKTVLNKYGTPTRIVIGSSQQTAAPSGVPGMAPTPTMGGEMGGMRDLSPFAGLGAGLGPGALPGLSSVGGPPGSGLSPMPVGPGGSGEQQPASDEIRWTYDLPKNGPTVEFIVDDGLVSQITVTASKAWAPAKTTKGVKIGDDYKTVLLKYGYPDKQEYVGRYLRVGYLQRSNIMFTLRDSKTVVGITIGLKED